MFCYDELSLAIFNNLHFQLFSTEAPVLLYYSHLTAIIVSLVLSFFIVFNTKALPARILAIMSVVFSALAVLDILLWTQIDSRIIMFLWSFWPFLFITIYVLSLYFLHAFISKRDASFTAKLVAFVLLLGVLVVSASSYAFGGFDLYNCNAIEGFWAWQFFYGISFIIFLGALGYGIGSIVKIKDGSQRRQAILATIGIACFLLFFSAAAYVASIANLLGSEPDIFNLEQYGYFGMTIFIAFLTYTIVEYKAFNIKLIAAQALVAALVILVGSQFFFIRNPINYALNGVTLASALGFGFLLVRSVKKEVEQREHLEILTHQLEVANDRLKELDQMKSEFLSIASHQLRAPITAIRGYAANINDGAYGEVPNYLKEPLDVVQESSRLMVSSIEDYLNISRIEQGRMKYEKSTFDLADLAKKVVNELQPVAAKKQLTLTANSPEDLMVTADIGKIKQVLSNLIDNAIKYTPAGSVTVTVDSANDKARVTIVDTGIGIAPEEIGILFEKFKRARGANKVNTTGTGLGLFVAKQLVEGHGGTVRVESEGTGKGTHFIVELPL